MAAKRIVIKNIRDVGIDGRRQITSQRRHSGIGGPLEALIDDSVWRDWFSEKTRCNSGYGRSSGFLFSLIRHGCRRANADRRLPPAKAILDATHKHRDIRTLP
ncbi:MAG: hypothetical protein LC130_14535, partial [Bryobacterales bacterium]|nr:hypothetical protein [Bryobacterales bacterium]